MDRRSFPPPPRRLRGARAPFRVLLAKLSHARLRPRDVLVPRRVPRRLVRLERVLPLDLPADHLLHAQALLRRLSLQLFQLGDVVLAPVLIRSFGLRATLLHRGRQRLAQALFHVLRRHHDGYEPRQTPGFDRAHDGGHLPPVQPAEDDASLRSKLASLVKSLVRPGRLPVGFADLQRRVQGPAQVLLRNGRDGHVVAAELVEQLAHPRDLLGSESREEHRGGPLGFLVTSSSPPPPRASKPSIAASSSYVRSITGGVNPGPGSRRGSAEARLEDASAVARYERRRGGPRPPPIPRSCRPPPHPPTSPSPSTPRPRCP